MKRLIFVIFIFLIGCGEIEYPKWYKSPPSDNSFILYATGNGLDKQSAVNSALSHIASKISTSISSEITVSKSYSTTSGLSRDIQQKITQKVNNFNFYDYQVKQIKRLKDNTYVALVAINKKKNAQMIIDKSKTILNTIKKEFNNLNNPIEKFKYAKSKLQLIQNEIIPNLFIAKVLGAYSDNIMKKAITLKLKLQKYIENIKVKIIANKYQNLLKEAVSNANLSISKHSNLIVSMKINKHNLKAFDRYITQLTADVNVIYNGKIYYSTTIKALSKSLINYETSTKLAKIELEKKLKEIIKNIF